MLRARLIWEQYVSYALCRPCPHCPAFGEVRVQFVNFQAILWSVYTNLRAFSRSCRTRANGTVQWTRQYGKGTSRYNTILNLAAAVCTCLPDLSYFSLVHARVLYARSIRTVSNLRRERTKMYSSVMYSTAPRSRSLILYCKFLNSRRKSGRTRVGLGPGKILRDPYRRPPGGFEPRPPKAHGIKDAL